MKIKFLSFLLPLSLCVSAGFGSVWDGIIGDHLRSFTPCHNVLETFSPSKKSSKAIFTISKNTISNEDYKLMAKIVYGESKGEPFLGKVGVASVILNRLYDPDFPKTVEGVIYQKNAFSCINGKNLSSEPDKECYRAVDEALNGNDPTSESIYFYNPERSSSSWILKYPRKCSVRIGNHIFFR